MISINSRFKGYKGIWAMVAVILIHALLGRPVEPWMPTESELTEITGIAEYMYGSPTKFGGRYLKVNDKVLNCDVGYYGASGGCIFPEVRWDKHKSVRATYFWMSSRWGVKDRMLHSITQDGQQVISPQRTFEDRVIGYKSGREFYWQFFVFNVFGLAFVWFVERQNTKLNSTH